jgi:hypothetical protein
MLISISQGSGNEGIAHRSDKSICGEFARRTFLIRPGLPKTGLLQRMRELDVTAPKPRLQRVAMSLLREN